MKKIATGLAATLLLFGLSLATPKDETFTGEIMDSQCAQAGSHETMMKKAGLNDPGQCTRACVKMGGTYVLYNRATKTIYQLDDQKKPEQFAGQTVTVKGTLDKSTKTIHVTDIQASS